jgi:hypothetical protein
VLNTPVRYVGNDQARAVAALQESVHVAIRVGFFKQQVACGNHCFLGMRIPAIVTADSDGSDHSFRSIATSVMAPSGAFSDLSVCARRQAGRPEA